MDSFTKLQVKLKDIGISSSRLFEDKYTTLPDLARYRLSGLEEAYSSYIKNDADKVLSFMKNENASIENLIHTALNDREKFRYFGNLVEQLKFQSIDFLFVARLIHLMDGGAFFTIKDGLNRQLELSDFSDRVPSSMLQLPLRSVYIKFGETLSSNIRLKDFSSGDHIVEGCYLTVSKDVVAKYGITCPIKEIAQPKGVEEGQLIDIYDIAIIGSPMGKRGIIDDSFRTAQIIINEKNKNEPIGDVVKDQLEKGFKYDNRYSPKQIKQISTEILVSVEHAVKCLLYLNIKDIRRVEKPEYSEFKQRVDSAGPSKRKKLERKLNKLHDTIYIGPEDSNYEHQSLLENKSDSKVSPHIRRGHFHTVKYGKGKKFSKLVYFNPIIVNSENIGDNEPSPKSYEAT